LLIIISSQGLRGPRLMEALQREESAHRLVLVAQEVYLTNALLQASRAAFFPLLYETTHTLGTIECFFPVPRVSRKMQSGTAPSCVLIARSPPHCLIAGTMGPLAPFTVGMVHWAVGVGLGI